MKPNNYYKAGQLLIQHSQEHDVYWIRNSIERVDKRLTKEYVELLPDLQLVKQHRFFELLNIYFNSVKHTWEFEGEQYRKLDNFEIESFNNGYHTSYKCVNYDVVSLMKHSSPKWDYKTLIMVYHHGKVCLMLYSYGGYPQGQLFDVKTGGFLQWARPKNCAPIFNVSRKVIM